MQELPWLLRLDKSGVTGWPSAPGSGAWRNGNPTRRPPPRPCQLERIGLANRVGCPGFRGEKVTSDVGF